MPQAIPGIRREKSREIKDSLSRLSLVLVTSKLQQQPFDFLSNIQSVFNKFVPIGKVTDSKLAFPSAEYERMIKYRKGLLHLNELSG